MLTRNKLLGVLLLLSLMLNVALGVAVFTRRIPSNIPPHPRDMNFTPLPPGVPAHFRDVMRGDIAPLMDEQHCLIRDLFFTLSSDSLDTVRLRSLSDSLGEMRCKIQTRMFAHAAEMHGKLSPEQREHFYSTMIGRMDHARGPYKNRHWNRN